MPGKILASLAALSLSLSVVAPARADKPAHAGKPDKGKTSKASKHPTGPADRDEVKAGFSSRQRDGVRVYFVERHGRGKCPPGLAKKHNGCLPPGIAKKRYVIGRPLPVNIQIGPVPADIVIHLGPPPAGVQYGIVDGDVVKLVIGTLLVVDAIDGLVN